MEDTVPHPPSIFVLHPLEPAHLVWDAFVSLIMIYVVVVVPIKICFQVSPPLQSAWSVFDLCVDVIFLLDMSISFNTGYFHGVHLVTSRRKIAKRYLKGWFFTDALTSIPFEWLIDASHAAPTRFSQIAWILKILRTARLLKILRLVKLMATVSEWENTAAYWTTSFRIFKFLSLIFFTAHIAACCFMGIANLYRSNDRSFENFYGFHELSWPVRFQDTWSLSKYEQYLRALYWAFTTLTTVGYGDVTPLLPLEIIFTCCVQVSGTAVFGFIIGNIASLISKDDETKLMVKEKIHAVAHYIRHREFPDYIAKKIKRHFEYSWRQNQVSKEAEILSDMPQALRAECALFVHQEIIQRVPFLSGLGEDVVPHLVTRLRPLLCFKGDVVIQEELFGNEMFFISDGSLVCNLAYRRTLDKVDQIQLSTLSNGDYFAEYAVILDQAKHPASVIATSNCDVHVLSRANFREFGQEFPLVHAQLISLCKARYLLLTRNIIKQRQWHLMKLNILEWDKKDAVDRGEDPDELTITPDDQRGKLVDLLAKRNSVTTINQRIRYRLEHKKLLGWIPPPDDLLHLVRKKTHAHATIHPLPKATKSFSLKEKRQKIIFQTRSGFEVLKVKPKEKTSLPTPPSTQVVCAHQNGSSSIRQEEQQALCKVSQDEVKPINDSSFQRSSAPSSPNSVDSTPGGLINMSPMSLNSLTTGCFQSRVGSLVSSRYVAPMSTDGFAEVKVPTDSPKYTAQAAFRESESIDAATELPSTQRRGSAKLNTFPTVRLSSKSFAIKRTISSRLGMAGSRESSKVDSTYEAPREAPPPRIDEVKQTRNMLPFWLLVKILSWKNRAQLRVAVNHIEVVEKRHERKFNLRTKKLDSSADVSAHFNRTNGPAYIRSPIETARNSRKDSQYIEPRQVPQDRIHRDIQEKLLFFEQKQNQTQEDLKDLQISVEEMKREMHAATQLLSLIAHEMSQQKEVKLSRPPTAAKRRGTSSIATPQDRQSESTPMNRSLFEAWAKRLTGVPLGDKQIDEVKSEHSSKNSDCMNESISEMSNGSTDIKGLIKDFHKRV